MAVDAAGGKQRASGEAIDSHARLACTCFLLEHIVRGAEANAQFRNAAEIARVRRCQRP